MTTVLISGANRGLGLEFVKQYVAEGAEVIAGCRNPGSAKELKAALGAKGCVYALDVADPGCIDEFAQKVGSRPIDILVANAGVYGGQRQTFDDIDYDAWTHTFEVNTFGPVRLAQAFAPNVVAAKGKLVAITSLMGSITDSSGGYFAYRASKAALNSAFKGVAMALKDKGVITAVLHPGWVQTDMGGQSAPLTPEQSVTGMRKVIEGLGAADVGSFHDFSGKVLPW